MRFLPKSLLNRVFLLYGLTLGAMLAGGMTVYLRSDVARSVDSAGDTANMIIEIAAQAIVDAVLVNDQDAVNRTLLAAVSHTPFASASYIERDGSVLAATSSPPRNNAAPEALRRWIGAQLPDVNRVIASGGRDYGVLRLGFLVDDVAEQLWQTGLRALALSLLSLAVGLSLTRLMLARWLSNLQHLGRYVEEIRAGRLDVNATASQDAPEEVRRTLEQFNSANRGMRDRFGARIDELSYSLVQHKSATDMAVIVVELDLTGRVTYVNDLFCAVSGWSREAFVGRDHGWSLREGGYRDLAGPGSSTVSWTGELPCEREDGKTVWVKRTVVPIRTEDGRLEKFICLDIDISREKSAERTLQEEKDRAEVTLHSIADGVLTLDADDRIRYANPAAQAILGLTADQLVDRHVDALMQVVDMLPAELGAGSKSRVRLPNGEAAVIESSRAPLRDVLGRPTGEVIAFRNVTREHRIVEELNRLSLAVKYAASSIVVTDTSGRAEYVNPVFEQMTGFSFDDIGGQTLRFLKSGKTPNDTYHAMWSAMRAGSTWRGELLNRRKDGSLFWCSLTLSTVFDVDGKPRQFVAVMEDVSDRKHAEETIHRLAYFDALTELPNRRMFMERAVETVKDARLAEETLAVCYLDLDGFKNVNDTLGHRAGDLLLAEVARRIGGCLRAGEFLGRLGGDEFALLLQPATPASVSLVGTAIADALAQTFELEGTPLRISTSIGVAMYPEDGQDVADLLRKADMALYCAKEEGKRKLVFFTSDVEEQRRHRSEMEAALREAVERGEMRLHYQPKIDMAHQGVVGTEALLRWQHPTKGLVSPDLFIPLAEETRLIVPIGRWVIEQACLQIKEWENRGLVDVHVAVNISSIQFRSPDLAEEIERIVRASGIRPGQLELEVTESGLMEDPDGVAAILQRLREIGLTIAIDDFGTGFSSLAYLKSFPIGVLKIDRSFVRDLEIDANDRGIAEAVISMARVLKVVVVAEGVETPGQMSILAAMGCQLAQGYYFSRPITAQAFESYWWRHRPHTQFEPTRMDAYN